MRKIIAAFIIMALFAIAANANITTGNEETATQYFNVGNPIKFEDTDYYFAWSSRPYDFYMLQEYLPEGETFEHYNQMFTVSVMFVGDAPMKADKAVEFKIAELEEVKKTDPMCNYLAYENDGDYLLDFIVSKSDDKGKLEFVEVDIHYYRDIEINGIKAVYLLFYSCRAYGDDIKPFLKSLPDKRDNGTKTSPRSKSCPNSNSKSDLRNRAAEADHVAQEDAVFDYRMVVIVGKETGDAVGVFEAAFFVEADSRRHISRADNHRFVSSGIMTGKHLNHFPAKAPALTIGPHGYIFQFTHAGTFVGDDTFAHDDIAVDKNKHFAAPEIAVDHRLLLVGKQQQIQIAFLAICNLFHNQSHADTYLGVIRRLKRLSEARAQR